MSIYVQAQLCLQLDGTNMVYSRSQTEFTLRCMFPAYADWDAFTPSGSKVPLRGNSLTTLVASAVAVAVAVAAAVWYGVTKYM